MHMPVALHLGCYHVESVPSANHEDKDFFCQPVQNFVYFMKKQLTFHPAVSSFSRMLLTFISDVSRVGAEKYIECRSGAEGAII